MTGSKGQEARLTYIRPIVNFRTSRGNIAPQSCSLGVETRRHKLRKQDASANSRSIFCFSKTSFAQMGKHQGELWNFFFLYTSWLVCKLCLCFVCDDLYVLLFVGISHELHWSVGFGTIVSCEDDSFQNQKYPCVARFFTFVNTKDERLTSLATAHNSAIWVCMYVEPDCNYGHQNLAIPAVFNFCTLYFKAAIFERSIEDLWHKSTRRIELRT